MKYLSKIYVHVYKKYIYTILIENYTDHLFMTSTAYSTHTHTNSFKSLKIQPLFI